MFLRCLRAETSSTSTRERSRQVRDRGVRWVGQNSRWSRWRATALCMTVCCAHCLGWCRSVCSWCPSSGRTRFAGMQRSLLIPSSRRRAWYSLSDSPGVASGFQRKFLPFSHKSVMECDFSEQDTSLREDCVFHDEWLRRFMEIYSPFLLFCRLVEVWHPSLISCPDERLKCSQPSSLALKIGSAEVNATILHVSWVRSRPTHWTRRQTRPKSPILVRKRWMGYQ